MSAPLLDWRVFARPAIPIGDRWPPALRMGVDRSFSSICSLGNEDMTMKCAILGSAALLLLLAASASVAQEKADEAIDCSAFHKEEYGYLVTKATRIATSQLDVTVPKGMPIR